MTSEVQPLGYTIEEAAKRLREPPPSRGTMYNLVNAGLLQVSGYIGDRPFFTDQALQDCATALYQRTGRRQGHSPAIRRTR